MYSYLVHSSLRKERKLLDMFKEAASNRPDKKEREEIESLRSEVYMEWYLCIAWYCSGMHARV